MGEIVVKYPLDLTGVSPDNYVTGDVRTLPNETNNRTIVPRYSPFYTNSLTVKDTATGEALTENVDYLPVMYYEEPSIRSGLEICGAVVITNPEVSSEVELAYQTIGGPYFYITNILDDLVEDLNIDDREVLWGDMLGRPDFYPPVEHLHHLKDIRGFEYVVSVLEEINQALMYGDALNLEKYNQALERHYDTLLGKLNTHKNAPDHDNQYVNLTGDNMTGGLTMDGNFAVGGQSAFAEISSFDSTAAPDEDGYQFASDVIKDALVRGHLVTQKDAHIRALFVQDAASSRQSLDVLSSGETRGFSVAMSAGL